MARPKRITRKPFMSVNEVAMALCMSKATIHRSLNRNDFPIRHFVINGTIRFLRHEVESFLGLGESELRGTG